MAKILLVDDEEAILKMYGSALTEHEVIEAKNGTEAIEKAEKDAPDIILLDIIMPKENGLDVLKKLKTGEKTKDIPVIVLTNLPEEASAEKAKTLGSNGYLVKAETEPTALAEEVNKLLG